MKRHNKTMSYVGAVALVIGAASPTLAQQTGPSCVAEIAQARAQIARALAAFPTVVDPTGPNSGAGRALAEQIMGAPNSAAGRMTPTVTGDNNPSGAGRALAGGFPTPADPLGPNSGAGRDLAQAPSPTIPENPVSGADRRLAAGLPTPADPLGPNSGAGRELAAQIQGAPNSGAGRMTPTVTGDNNPSGAGRELAGAAGTGTSGSRGRIQEAQALVGAAQSACDPGDTATGVAKARQAVNILR